MTMKLLFQLVLVVISLQVLVVVIILQQQRRIIIGDSGIFFKGTSHHHHQQQHYDDNRNGNNNQHHHYQQQQRQTLLLDPVDNNNNNSYGQHNYNNIISDNTYNNRIENDNSTTRTNKNGFMIGTGIYDITGPAAQINFMGYALPSQTGHGIHMRLRARAFIISELPTTEVILSSSLTKSTTTTTTTTTTNYDATINSNNNNDTTTTTNNSNMTKTNNKEIANDSNTVPLLPSFKENNIATSRHLHSLRHAIRDENSSTLHDQKTYDDDTNLEQPVINPNTTICFVSIDACMGSDLLTYRVIQRLDEIRQTNGTVIPCTIDNLSISGAHSHSGPGGFLQYAVYQVTSFGFSEEVISAFVDGVVQSLLRAYDKLQPGSIELAHGLLLHNTGINRSPTSYLLNPMEERNEYENVGGNVDKNMIQLNFRALDDNETPLGLLNWFAVHPTSMNKTNTLISGDNKGYAAYLSERYFNSQTKNNPTTTILPGKGSFVAAFASTNFGDVSPNIAGPRCIDTGLPCDEHTSSFNDGNCMICIASGPGRTMKESTKIIGSNQYNHSLQLWNLRNELQTKINCTSNPDNCTSSTDQLQPFVQKLQGMVRSRHSFIDITAINVTLPNGDIVSTCPGALGYSFAAGTTDGPGEYPFVQGTNTSAHYLDSILGLLSTPSKEQIMCHAPKPIIINAGDIHTPYPWIPKIVPISIFQIGSSFFILNVPSEFTTMAGRRLKKAVREVLMAKGSISDPQITIAGLANSYSHYVTTHEEYTNQRYEGACTLYGPHTLAAYIQEFQRIATDLVSNNRSTTLSGPIDLTKQQVSFIPPTGIDLIGVGYEFGSVVNDANDTYRVGDHVKVRFRSANPRNNQRIEGTYLTVDKLNEANGVWETLYVDGDWCTEFHWNGGIQYWGQSFVDVVWEIPHEVSVGLYRVCHYGTRRTLVGGILSSVFVIPNFIVTNLIGSHLFDFIYQSLEVSLSFSSTWKEYYKNLTKKNMYDDFEGCSKTFLIHP